MKPKLLRITTVPVSLKTLLKGQHRYMSQHFEVVGVSSPGEALQEVAVNEGIRVRALEMTRSLSPLRDLRSLWQLVKLIRQEKPQLVHTHTPKAGTVGMLAAWLCRVPVRLHTVAGLPLMEATGPKRVLLNGVEKMTYACATRVYPNSFGLRDFIVQSGFCKPGKLHVIGQGSSNGIDTAHFSPAAVSVEQREQTKQSLGLAPGDFVFVFVGRLVRDKGIQELVTAFGMVHKRFPQTKLLLVGNEEPELDPLTPETRATIRKHQNIMSTGYQTDVRPFLAVSHALAFPSYREGFPNVPMQAGAMGLPCIVTDINGCNEIVTDGHNGLIIPPKNAEALEAAMIRLLDDRALTQQLASQARESIVSRFEQQGVWELIKAEYDKQLEKAGMNV